MKKFIELAAIVLAFSCTASAQAQKTKTTCPPVAAKNKQEALLMEQASDKNGCWSRDQNGQLVFLSDTPPSKNYKPLITGPKTRCPKLPTAASSVSALAGHLGGKPDPIIGKWRVKCCSFLGGTGVGSFAPHASDGTMMWGGTGTLEIDSAHRPHWSCERVIFTRTQIGQLPSRTLACTDPAAAGGDASPWDIDKNDVLTGGVPGTYLLEGGKDGEVHEVQITINGDTMRGQACIDFGDDVSTQTVSFSGSHIP